VSGDADTIRVAHLIKGLGRGGAEGLLPQTIRAGSEGFAYSVGYFLPWKDALAADVEAAGAPVTCFATRSNATLLAAVPRVARWLRRSRADLVHAHLPLTGVVARFAGRLAGVPVVYTEHNLQPRYHPWTRRANAWTWGWQAAAVAVSGEVAESISEHLGDRVAVTVVRNGIEIRRRASDERLADVRRRFDVPAGAPVVGTVAVLRRQKRLDLWLEAARRMLAERRETCFLVVGDGPVRGELEAEATRAGIAGSVRFTGLQEDVQPFLDLMDVYLMSSEFEGLPLALLEAMASGVAPVVTAVGGIPEVVRDGADGVLVPFGDPAALAAATLSLLADAERRGSLAAAARRRVKERFGIARMARELEAIYARVLAPEGATDVP
jgi:glycosyltransferase involved in cell wall biosynthesis